MADMSRARTKQLNSLPLTAHAEINKKVVETKPKWIQDEEDAWEDAPTSERLQLLTVECTQLLQRASKTKSQDGCNLAEVVELVIEQLKKGAYHKVWEWPDQNKLNPQYKAFARPEEFLEHVKSHLPEELAKLCPTSLERTNSDAAAALAFSANMKKLIDEHFIHRAVHLGQRERTFTTTQQPSRQASDHPVPAPGSVSHHISAPVQGDLEDESQPIHQPR